MVREYLYRAKSKDNGEWVYGSYVQTEQLLEDAMHFIVGGYGDRLMPIEVDGNTVCEYTGLKDKNGTKIFEGDLLGLDWANGHKIILNVVLVGYAARFEFVILEKFGYVMPPEYIGELEVIGNKFDNPELLEVQDETN